MDTRAASDDPQPTTKTKRPHLARSGKPQAPIGGGTTRVLSNVLSKALLLANDDAITDPTITSQIKRR